MVNTDVVGAIPSGKSADNLLFDNLEWLNSEEAARFLRKSVGALRVMVHRGQIRARRFRRRLYFRKSELDDLLETSELIGGIHVGRT